MVAPVNEMSIKDAAKYYASMGIITQPLHGPVAKVTSPGKQPMLNEWQKLQKPFSAEEINRRFSEKGNLGFLCGER